MKPADWLVSRRFWLLLGLTAFIMLAFFAGNMSAQAYSGHKLEPQALTPEQLAAVTIADELLLNGGDPSSLYLPVVIR